MNLAIHLKPFFVAQRHIFFEEIVAACTAPLTSSDLDLPDPTIMWSVPEAGFRVLDAEAGVLVIDVFAAEVGGEEFRAALTVVQQSFALKLSVSIGSNWGMAKLPWSDLLTFPRRNWSASQQSELPSGGQYECQEPELYEHWLIQEAYVLGLRKLLLRLFSLLGAALKEQGRELKLCAIVESSGGSFGSPKLKINDRLRNAAKVKSH